jgi:hypothetical protein
MANINDILAYENSELDAVDTVRLFSELIKSGEAWKLQGHYGRTASMMIQDGVLDNKGGINHDRLDELLECC